MATTLVPKMRGCAGGGGQGQRSYTRRDKASWTSRLLPGASGTTAALATHLAILILPGQPAFLEVQQVGLRKEKKRTVERKAAVSRFWVKGDWQGSCLSPNEGAPERGLSICQRSPRGPSP